MDRVSVFIVGLCLAVVVPGEGQRIPAEIGRNVTLPCETKELPCVKVEWTSYNNSITFNVTAKDIKLPEDAPGFYQGRVELQDPQNGKVSLVLKNVTAEDKGRYECRVQKASNPSNTDPNKPINTVYLDVLPPPDQRISAVIGEDVTLPCETKEHKVVKWSRPGVEAESIIFLTEKNSDPKFASERYQGRVQLKSPQNGDVSLVLKNVMAEDGGTYECYILKESNRRKRSIDQPISTVYLDVRPLSPPDVRLPPPPHVPPPSGGANIGLIVGLLVAAVAAAAAVAAFVLKKKKQKSSPPSDKEAEKPLQIPPTAADPSIP